MRLTGDGAMKLTDEERRQRDIFRDWVRAIQAQTGHSTSSLAELAGLSPSTINRPMGRDDYRVPKWATLLKIARAARVDPPESLAPSTFTQPHPATVDEQEPDEHYQVHEASGEIGGMRSTDIEILSQLVDDYGAAEVIRQLRQLPEKPGSRQKRGIGS